MQPLDLTFSDDALALFFLSYSTSGLYHYHLSGPLASVTSMDTSLFEMPRIKFVETCVSHSIEVRVQRQQSPLPRGFREYKGDVHTYLRLLTLDSNSSI